MSELVKRQKLGENLFPAKQIFRKIIFWFHFSLSSPSPPKSPHLNLEHRVPEGKEKGLRLDGCCAAREKSPGKPGRDIQVKYSGQQVTTAVLMQKCSAGFLFVLRWL